MRSEILRVNYNNLQQGGYFGRERTLEVIRRFYQQPKLTKDVRKYVKTYNIYQRIKAPRYRLYRLLSPLPQPNRPQQDISIDFITGLPPSLRRKVVYDALLVVVYRFSKIVRYIPYSVGIVVEELGDTLVKEVFLHFKVLRSIVSD